MGEEEKGKVPLVLIFLALKAPLDLSQTKAGKLKMIQISSSKDNYLPRMFQPMSKEYSPLCTSLMWGQTELTVGQTKGGEMHASDIQKI